jgi:hypothetical protein
MPATGYFRKIQLMPPSFSLANGAQRWALLLFISQSWGRYRARFTNDARRLGRHVSFLSLQRLFFFNMGLVVVVPLIVVVLIWCGALAVIAMLLCCHNSLAYGYPAKKRSES